MNANDILGQIDTALEDWSVSGDAMRSRPETDESGKHNSGSLLRVGTCVELPEVDPEFQRAWEEFHDGMVRIQIERARRGRQIIDVLVRAFRELAPVAQEADRAIESATDHVQQARPGSGRKHALDRPVWQSPYGPVQRRH